MTKFGHGLAGLTTGSMDWVGNASQGFYLSLQVMWHCRPTPKYYELECGPMPNLMVALPNTGGALCSTPQSFADAHY